MGRRPISYYRERGIHLTLHELLRGNRGGKSRGRNRSAAAQLCHIMVMTGSWTVTRIEGGFLPFVAAAEYDESGAPLPVGQPIVDSAITKTQVLGGKWVQYW